MKTVYISYDRNHPGDEALADEIKARLEPNATDPKHEFTVILDKAVRNTLTTQDISSLKKSAQSADKVIFIMSAGAFASYQCNIELSAVLSKTIRELPLFWRTHEQQLEKIVPIVWRETDIPAYPIIQQNIKPNSIDSNLTETKISPVLEEVGRINWVLFRKYYLAQTGDYDKGEKIEPSLNINHEANVAYMHLRNAINNPLRTWQAFLSYARINVDDYVGQFRKDLEERFEIWFDIDAIAKGKSWQEEIYRGIEGSHNFLFVVSNAWLLSPNCQIEYYYAVQHNKRLIPVILENFSEEMCLKILKEKKSWAHNDVIGKAEAIWQQVISLSPIRVTDKKDNQSIISELAERFTLYGEYISWHTAYLIQAKNAEVKHKQYRKKQKEYLRGDDLDAAWSWLQNSRNQDFGYPPSEAHIQFIYDSRKQKRQRQIVATTLLGLIIGVIISLGILFIRQLEATQQREQELARENARQLILNSAVRYNLHSTPKNSVIAFQHLWIRQEDNAIARIGLNGIKTDIIPLVDETSNLIEGASYLWANHNGDDFVTRIQPTTGETRKQPTGQSPESPIFTDDYIWVYASIDGTITRATFELEDVTTIKVGLNIGHVFSTPNAIWYLDSTGNYLKWLDTTLREPEQIKLGMTASQAIYHEPSGLIVVLSDTSIILVDPHTHTVHDTLNVSQRIVSLTNGGDYLWGVLGDHSGFARIDPINATIGGILEDNVQHITYLNGNIWSATTAALSLYRADDLTLVNTALEINDVLQLRTPTSDGKRAWFSLPERGIVYLLDEATGQVITELPFCRQISQPQFDGATMWFTCAGDDTVVAVPADIQFEGESTVLTDLETHQPILMGDVVWLTQQATGRISAVNMATGEKILTLDYGQSITALQQDGDYLWFGIIQTGDVYRIDTQNLPTTPTQAIPNSLVSEPIPTGLEISTFRFINEYIWVQHFDLNNQTFLSIIERDTLSIRLDAESSALVGGVTVHQGEVYASTMDLQQAYIVRLDPATGAIKTQIPMPETPFASYEPLFYNGLLWYTAVVPPPTLMFQITTAVASPNHELYDPNLPFYLVGIDPQTDEVKQVIALPTWTTYPQPQGDIFWLRMLATDLTGTEALQSSTGVVAINIVNGESLGIWSTCAYDSPLYVVGQYAWLGCWDVDDTFGIIDAQQQELVNYYDALGMFPNKPLEHDGYLIFTFRDTGTLAVFDVTTGELLHTAKTGDYPQQPFYYDDAIWVYNAGSDTLQRMILTD